MIHLFCWKLDYFCQKRVDTYVCIALVMCLNLLAFMLFLRFRCTVNDRVFSCIFLKMVTYSLYEILFLRWYQWWRRDCAPVPGCHVCQAEKASFPATRSCFPKATLHACSSCTSKFQCWDLGNKQDINASTFYLLELLAYWLKCIGFFDADFMQSILKLLKQEWWKLRILKYCWYRITWNEPWTWLNHVRIGYVM